MIVYNEAFDIYHSIFRIMHLLDRFEQGESIELDRIRIWDFYTLFPEKVHEIRLKYTEKDIRTLRKKYIKRQKNPYTILPNNRRLFELLRPYQVAALHCLASYGIIDKKKLTELSVVIKSKRILRAYVRGVGDLTPKEKNAITLLTTHFHQMAIHGQDGLKNRTNLMESKYDA